MRHIKTHFFILIILCGMLAATHAHAATVTVVAGAGNSAAVAIDTDGSTINALSGTLTYPAGLQVIAVTTTDSIVPIWIEQPHAVSGRITWSGIIPGGYSGTRSPYYSGTHGGVVFGVQFAPADGTAPLGLTDVTLLANDGSGTPVPAQAQGAVMSFSQTAPPVMTQDAGTLTATIAHDDTVENGKWFVAFHEDTSRRSIERYEIAESTAQDAADVGAREWHAATTPYILNDQSRSRYVHIRSIAIDGSISSITIDPVDDGMKNGSLWSILLVLFIAGYIITRRRNRHEKNIH